MAEGKGANNPGGGLLDRIVLQGLNLGTELARARLIPTAFTQAQPNRAGTPPTVVRQNTGVVFDNTTLLVFGGAAALVLVIALTR